MIRIHDLSLPLGFPQSRLKEAAAGALKIPAGDLLSLRLVRKSVDARKKDKVHFICAVEVAVKGDEERLVKRLRSQKVSIAAPYAYELPPVTNKNERPLVVGMGPAGLFAGLVLAQAGARPLLIERGRDVDTRTRDVTGFFAGGSLDTSSNVQFGEGGAGTFSDGKLNTGTKDRRAGKVLLELVNAGAPEEILYEAKPHIGTDKLKTTVKNLRKAILALGGEILFETQMTELLLKNGSVAGIRARRAGGETVEFAARAVVLAIGHSARDTFDALYGQGVVMQQKPFSVGARIEHPQALVNKAQYGRFYNHPALGAADYKLAVHLNNGRGVYTFCMCPGGQVVAAASEEGRLVTNGMSEFSRNGQNANSALLVGVTPADFPDGHPLSGVRYQRELERSAFLLGGGDYKAPAQRVEDFLKKRESVSMGCVAPSYLPGVTPASLDSCLPPVIADSMRMGILEMDKRLHGFAFPDAVLTGVETRSSSPVRMARRESLQAEGIDGLYPCGEGAGYAGGIVSAAVDGVKCAERILAL